MTSRAAKPSSALLAAKKAARDRLKQEESSASSVFHKNTGQDDTIHPKILQAARSTGQLNLSGRGLVIVPERVWKITELDKEEEAKVKNKGFSMDAVSVVELNF